MFDFPAIPTHTNILFVRKGEGVIYTYIVLRELIDKNLDEYNLQISTLCKLGVS